MDLLEIKTLVLGIGGGYDIYTSLPWFLSLSPLEQSNCILANYSFTDGLFSEGSLPLEVDSHIVSVTPETIRSEKNKDYFPEHHLSHSLNRTIYAIHLIPCPFLTKVLISFIKQHQIKQIYMFDGGVDSIIFGGEHPYGSPTEDSQMVLACYQTGVHCRLFVSALGVDDYNIDAYLKHWKRSSEGNLPLEVHSNNKYKLGPSLIGWKRYVQIVHTSEPPSIIQESIVAAGEGHRGKYRNLRLYPSRIENESNLPFLLDETDTLWEWNLHRLVQESNFYQHLLTELPNIELPNEEFQWNDLWDRLDQIIVKFLEQECTLY